MVTVRNSVATQPRNFMLKEFAAYLGLRNNQGHREGVRAPKKNIPPLTARVERLKSSHLIVKTNSQMRSDLGLI
jgi:hypothetical protein